MIVTFPNMGPLAAVLTQFFRFIGIPCAAPPDNSRDTLEKGMAVSPEEMCLPFKYMAGNFIEAYDRGADTALMVATCGPCRLGEYGELLKLAVQRAGCCYEWVLLDSPGAIGLKEFFERFGNLAKGRQISKVRMAEGIRMSFELLRRIDRLRNRASELAGYLEIPYDAVRVMHEMDKQLKYAGSFRECDAVIKAMEKRLRGLDRKKHADPVRILVAGEIYTSIEPEANGRLEEKLMKMGCSVTRHLDLSWWVRKTASDAVCSRLSDISVDVIRQRIKKSEAAGRCIIPCNVGGYGRETAARISRDGDADGVVKIMPSGCMPEIVTKAFCEKIQKEDGRKILHLIYDEMSGEAGYDTRLEAFADMLERRKHVLAGN